MVTIENALALFGLVLVTAFGAFALSVGVTQVRCVDAARDTARSAARGETDAVSRQAGRRSAPVDARIDISRTGDTVSVRVRASVRAPGLLSRVGTIDLSAGLDRRRRARQCAVTGIGCLRSIPVRGRREEGSATVMSLSWLAVLAVIGAAGLLMTLVAAAQHQVESAADLAAVSAATHIGDGEQAACAAAARVASSMHARVTSCRVDGLGVAVDVASTVRIPARRVVLTASARAGPADSGSVP